jgi:hypothetical protein
MKLVSVASFARNPNNILYNAVSPDPRVLLLGMIDHNEAERRRQED